MTAEFVTGQFGHAALQMVRSDWVFMVAEARSPTRTRNGPHGTGALGGVWGGASSPPHGNGSRAGYTNQDSDAQPVQREQVAADHLDGAGDLGLDPLAVLG